MNGLPYYKRYPRDFIEGTIGLPFELKVTYSFVLDLIYMQGGELPDDDRYISGLLGVSVRKWKSLRSGLIDAGKIQVCDGHLTNHRAVSELESLVKLSRNMSENRRRPNKNKDLASRKKNHTEPDTDTKKTTSSTPPTPPRGFEEFWELCPRRVGKKAAAAKYAKAVRDGVPPDKLNSAMAAYAKSDQVQRGYAKHPATWLNQGCWDDELPSNQSDDEALAAQGIREVEVEDDPRNFSRGGDNLPEASRDGSGHVSGVLTFPAKENGPVPERDVHGGGGGLALLALSAQRGPVF